MNKVYVNIKNAWTILFRKYWKFDNLWYGYHNPLGYPNKCTCTERVKKTLVIESKKLKVIRKKINVYNLLRLQINCFAIKKHNAYL